MLSLARASIHRGNLPPAPSAEAIRRLLQISPSRARAVRDRLAAEVAHPARDPVPDTSIRPAPTDDGGVQEPQQPTAQEKPQPAIGTDQEPIHSPSPTPFRIAPHQHSPRHPAPDSPAFQEGAQGDDTHATPLP